MITTIIIIFVVALLSAIYSMRDFDVPKEIHTLIFQKKARGTIVFLKESIKHYSSSSSSSPD